MKYIYIHVIITSHIPRNKKQQQRWDMSISIEPSKSRKTCAPNQLLTQSDSSTYLTSNTISIHVTSTVEPMCGAVPISIERNYLCAIIYSGPAMVSIHTALCQTDHRNWGHWISSPNMQSTTSRTLYKTNIPNSLRHGCHMRAWYTGRIQFRRRPTQKCQQWNIHR